MYLGHRALRRSCNYGESMASKLIPDLIYAPCSIVASPSYSA
uniref:Uncharacterized protein n=1 Tax=Rhizophora mucronata TaxID=61149 RepID=A0A2P2QY12_RHIMU